GGDVLVHDVCAMLGGDEWHGGWLDLDVGGIWICAHAEVCGEECGGEKVGDVVLCGVGDGGFVVGFDGYGIGGVGVDRADDIDPGVGTRELVFGGFDVWVVEVDVVAGGDSEHGCFG